MEKLTGLSYNLIGHLMLSAKFCAVSQLLFEAKSVNIKTRDKMADFGNEFDANFSMKMEAKASKRFTRVKRFKSKCFQRNLFPKEDAKKTTKTIRNFSYLGNYLYRFERTISNKIMNHGCFLTACSSLGIMFFHVLVSLVVVLIFPFLKFSIKSINKQVNKYLTKYMYKQININK